MTIKINLLDKFINKNFPTRKTPIQIISLLYILSNFSGKNNASLFINILQSFIKENKIEPMSFYGLP